MKLFRDTNSKSYDSPKKDGHAYKNENQNEKIAMFNIEERNVDLNYFDQMGSN